jgi:hypothetical protein
MAPGSGPTHHVEMVCRVCDPHGPHRLRNPRLLLPAVALALLLLGPLLPFATPLRAMAPLLGVALLFARLSLRLGPRTGTLELGAGRVTLRAGPLSQTIRAADVRAASTTRTPRGVALALVRREVGSRPLLLEVDRFEQLEEIRKSLKLGYLGFGEISWPARAGAGRVFSAAASLLLGVGWGVMALAAACGNAALVLTLALAAVPLSGLVLLATAIPWSARPRVSLTPHAVRLVDGTGVSSISYGDVVGVDGEADGQTARRPFLRSPRALVLRTDAGHVAVPTEELLAEEREHLRSQIECAVERAHGYGPPPPEVPPPLSRLAPHGEPTRAWLERVDAAAASLGEGGAYRQTELRTEDLWWALESPDAPASLRMAAARVLARVAPAEARVRIAHVLDSERDLATRVRICAGLEENLDAVAQTLDRLDRGWLAR